MAQLSATLATPKAPRGSEKWRTSAGMTSRTATTVGASSLRALAACSSVMPGTTWVVLPRSEPLTVPDANPSSSSRFPESLRRGAPERFSVHLGLRAGLLGRLHALVRVGPGRRGDPGGEPPPAQRSKQQAHPRAAPPRATRRAPPAPAGPGSRGAPGGDRPLDERSIHEPHPAAVLLREHLEHGLRREDGAAEGHPHEEPLPVPALSRGPPPAP